MGIDTMTRCRINPLTISTKMLTKGNALKHVTGARKGTLSIEILVAYTETADRPKVSYQILPCPASKEKSGPVTIT
jgi:hypothetical protein